MHSALTKPRKAADHAVALAWLGSAGALLPAGARWHWALELTTHFRVQMVVVLMIATLVLVALRRKKAAVVPFLVALGHAALVMPDVWPRIEAQGASPGALKIASINVLTTNPTPEKVRAFIAAEAPDVLVLIELSERVLKAVDPASLGYAWGKWELREDNFGMGIFARHPALAGLTDLAGDATPTGVLRLDINNHKFTIVGLHPLPPGSAYQTGRRDAVLRAAAVLAARERPRHVVLAGDLNTTPWSPAFADLVADSGLRSTHVGFGAGVTWWPPSLPLFAIPIDHVLVSPGLTVLERRIGPSLGSDHLPLVVSVKPQDAS